MWVIYDTDNGREIDRIESHSIAIGMIVQLNRETDYDHYAIRWEA